MKDQGRARLFALGAVLLWSTVASAFKLTLRHLDPLPLLAWASLWSTVALLATLVVGRRLAALRACTRHDLWRGAGLGLLNPFLYYVVLFEAYDRLPAQEAQPLNYTWAITLALLSVPLLGQRLRLASLAAILVSYSGVVVIATHGDLLGFRLSDPLGVGLALGSTVIWALYWIWNTRIEGDPVVRLFLGFAFGTLYSGAAAAVVAPAEWPDLAGLAGSAYVGFFEMGFTFVLWLSAMRLARSAAEIGNLIFLSPFLSLVLIHYVVGEDIHPSTLLGLVLIVAGIALQRWKGGEARGPREEPR